MVKRKSERKILSRLCIGRNGMNDETWHIVKECPKVLGFLLVVRLRNRRQLPNVKQDAILARVRNTGEAPRPKTMFEPGEELLA